MTGAAWGLEGRSNTGVTATWSFVSNHVNSFNAPAFQYTVHGEPAGSNFQLEREFGTAHVWKAVANVALSQSSGTAIAPKVPMGKYEYRARVIGHGQVLRISEAQVLFSYGNVVLATLCNAPNVQQGTCGQGTVQIASHVFSYE
jgi:hypothetical protein